MACTGGKALFSACSGLTLDGTTADPQSTEARSPERRC
jgi:hypothetical protein